MESRTSFHECCVTEKSTGIHTQENDKRLIEELQRRLEEAEQTIAAIREGEVDALVVSGKGENRVYTLEGADHPYRTIVETMNAGAVTINDRGLILYSNDAFSTMTGIPLNLILGSSFADFVAPEYLPLFLEFAEKTHEAKATAELAVLSPKGQVFVRLAGSSQMVYGAKRSCVVITDISDLKSAEESLRKEARLVERERDRLMTLIDNMSEGVWFARPDGRIVLANTVAKAQIEEVGINPDALFHTSWRRLLSQAEIAMPDGAPLDLQRLMSGFEGKAFRGVEVAMRNKVTGEVFYRRVSANPIGDATKGTAGVVMVVQDVTSSKRAEEEKARLENHLRQAQKMEAIGTLAGGIAHDFNNMLAVILGNAELAMDEVRGDDGVARNIEQIVKASKRARDLVRQILTFSRKNEAGKSPLKLTPLIKETHRLLRGTLPSTIRMNLDLRTERDSVAADPSQIQQVLMNLATNAAHAMQEKGGELTIGLAHAHFKEASSTPDGELPPGTYVKLTVRDTGKGMAEETRRRIFEPFFTTKPQGEGTGMGLAVVYGIVRSHEGAITVRSSPGRGAEFTILLPHAGEAAAEEAREPEAPCGGRERILLVDDEPLVLDMTFRLLEELGYGVATARNGIEAFRLFCDDPSRFDLVITDQTMPEMTGIALANRLLKKRKDLPIILFTGYSETASADEAKEAGIREFVMKPLLKREVAETIRRVLDAGRGSA